jgi:hypothetical protein
MENKSKFKPNPKLRLMDQGRHPDEPELKNEYGYGRKKAQKSQK